VNRLIPLPDICFPEDVRRLEKYFGESVVTIDGRQVPARQGFMLKGDEALEVADFTVQAAGGQARRGFWPNTSVHRDFEVVFRSNPLRSGFFHAVGS
jgi:hypothetical protein